MRNREKKWMGTGSVRAALVAACAFSAALVAPPAPASAAAGTPRIVAFDDLPRDAIKRLRRAGVTRAALFPAADAAAIVGPAAAYRRVRRWKSVDALYPERAFKLSTFQTKPSLGVDLIHAGAAPLPSPYTGKGVTVAVFDTGIESAHPDLDDRVAANLQFEAAGVLDPITDGGYSGSNPETPQGVDELQHGTLVAGIVAGTGESAKGADMRGMAPEATLVNFKLIGEATHEVPDDSIMETNALASYQWMIDHKDDPRFPGGIRVATNSWGWDGDFEPVAFTRMLEAARDTGIALVFAAGNTGPAPDTVAFPGRLDWIITVGASCKAQGVWSALCPDGAGQVADFSSRGAAVDVLAPGVDVWGAAAKLGFENTAFTPIGIATSPGSAPPPAPGSPNPADEVSNRAFYLYGPGTSFATPHVAGIVALMVQANPRLTQAQIERILQLTALDLGPAGFDPDNGHGHVDAFKAVAMAAAPPPAATAPVTATAPAALGGSAPAGRPPACSVSGVLKVRAPKVALRCDQAVTVTAKLTLPGRSARRLRVGTTIAGGRAAVAAGARTTLTLKLTAKARRRLRRLSRGQVRRLRPTLTAVATGTAGNMTLTRKVRLSR
jgi:serine protease AprX